MRKVIDDMLKDYLEIFERFKDVKDIKDLMNEVNKLRYYYSTQQFQQMQEHINSLFVKYLPEALVWNATNHDMPTTVQQAYINAENFLLMQGARILVQNVDNYKQYLTEEEISFIESMIKVME